jgi:hypothetical protein
MGNTGIAYEFWQEELSGRQLLEDLDEDVKVILILIL